LEAILVQAFMLLLENNPLIAFEFYIKLPCGMHLESKVVAAVINVQMS
jgi:hypothetical protein